MFSILKSVGGTLVNDHRSCDQYSCFFVSRATDPLLPKVVPNSVHVGISDIPLSQVLPGIRLPDLVN